MVIYTLANLLWIVPMMVLIPFYYRSIEYEMGEEEVIVRRGIITKTETTVPYRTVTNIDIKRGPLDRLLALGGLKIHTAGYSQQVAAEASLSGLSEYEQIYEALRSALRRYRARTGQTVGAEEVPAAEEGVGADVRHLLADILQELRALRRALEERG
ncbi:MAG: PH domain-containing protein [Chloroflexi bacterium]|nr:PH domain-containing protein [Chloroflexota bacterium]